MDKIKALEILVIDFLEPTYKSDEINKNSQLKDIIKGVFFNSPKIEIPEILDRKVVSPHDKEFDRLFVISDGKNRADSIEKRYRQLYNNIYPIWKELKTGILGAKIKNKKKLCDISLKADFRSGFVNYDFNQDVLIFLDLLQGVPLNLFKICKNDYDCSKWFVTKTIKKKYCTKNCGNRYRQKEFRDKDPIEYKKYHIKRYIKKCDEEREKNL